MIDIILNQLYKFLDEEYVESSLKIEFTDSFYKWYGIPMPQDANLISEYEKIIKYSDDGVNNIIVDRYNYTIPIFVKNKINDNFDNLKLDYYNVIRFEDDVLKKGSYYNLIYKQLNDLYSALKKQPFNNLYIIYFKNGIDNFKHEFGNTSTQRATFQRQLENSYVTIETGRYDNQRIQSWLRSLYLDLRTNKFIDINSEQKDFLKLFSGNTIKKRLEWTNTLSSFYYFNKKLNVLNHIKDLGDNKWHVANKCFYILNTDGVEFESYKFRSQKNPTQTTISILDKILIS